MKKSEIITLVIAAYGALLSTIVAVWQILSNRARVKMTVRRNMLAFGDPRYQGVTLTAITVTNVGRRPVTITSMGYFGLYPNLSLAMMDTIPQLPREITEGKFIKGYLPQNDLNFSAIDYWESRDSHERIYKVREASLLKHWKSIVQWKGWFRSQPAVGKPKVNRPS